MSLTLAYIGFAIPFVISRIIWGKSMLNKAGFDDLYVGVCGIFTAGIGLACGLFYSGDILNLIHSSLI